MERSTRDLRRRGLVLLMVAGLLLAAAAPALAKPGKPEEPKQYTVTMAGALATTCPGFSPSVIMTLSGNVLEARRQNLATDIDVDWTREFDAGYGTSGTSLTGCHGNALPLNENDLYAMWITLDLRKQRVSILWRFDPVLDDQGKPLELFQLASNPQGSTLQAGWVPFENGVVSGTFVLRRWRAGQSWQEMYTLDLTFDLSFTQA